MHLRHELNKDLRVKIERDAVVYGNFNLNKVEQDKVMRIISSYLLESDMRGDYNEIQK